MENRNDWLVIWNIQIAFFVFMIALLGCVLGDIVKYRKFIKEKAVNCYPF